MRWPSQVVAVTWFGLQTLPQRIGASLAAIFGIAGVVAVLVGVLSIAEGFQRTMLTAGSDDLVVVVRSGATSEIMSALTGEEAQVIADTEGVARGANGQLSSAELFVIIDLPKRSTGTVANVPLRGVEEVALEVHDDLEIVEGRMLEWGRNEVIVGDGAVREFAGIDVGDRLEVGGDIWSVVGRFTSAGGLAESEIWTDARLLQAAYRRGDSFQSVYARLASANDFDGFKDALGADPRVNVSVSRSSDYYAAQSVMLTSIITGLGYLVATLMAFGAVFGALNTMYSAVSARTREIATLRALGFKNTPVIVSVLFESLLLAVAGGFIGGGLAWVAFDGFRAATLNWGSFSQVAFAFDVTPGLLVQGALFATIIGLIGGLFPAIRAARIPVAEGLRAL